MYCQLAVLVLAAPVTYSTGCLTCRLAGCRHLAAAAFLHAVLQCACAQCLYVFHLYVLLHFLVYKVLQIISYVARLCKAFQFTVFLTDSGFLELFTGRHFGTESAVKLWWQQEFCRIEMRSHGKFRYWARMREQ